ncbi:hypothetical protein PIB30_100123 [Stylosanthes scabra]|uniref:Uncharacterized protein n=1 Tax=Stylosanthes scabra TaxID=79078 RepID=A0ABU6SXT1_9FABA|nr:hypothetical protein [Stylosanthes scabra]
MSVEGIKVDSGNSRVDSPSHLCEYKLNAVSLHFPLLLVYTLLDDSTLRSLVVSPVSLCSSHRYTLLGGKKEEAAVAPEKKKETTAVREEE